jgi:hypothetical protein
VCCADEVYVNLDNKEDTIFALGMLYAIDYIRKTEIEYYDITEKKVYAVLNDKRIAYNEMFGGIFVPLGLNQTIITALMKMGDIYPSIDMLKETLAKECE